MTKIFSSLLTLFFILTSLPAYARENSFDPIVVSDSAGESDSSSSTKIVKLNEIHVTSTRYETTVKNVSFPIEIADKHEMLGKGGTTPSEILESKPGLAVSKDGTWGTYVSIRGLGRGNIIPMINGNRIETATDLAAGLSLVENWDIKRIEVIKGAASSLYGSGALGGVVNIITESGFYPEAFRINGSVLSSYNSVNKNGSGFISLNSGNSNWFINLNTSIRSAGDTETPDGVLKNSQFRNRSVSFYSGYVFPSNNEVKISYQNFIAEDAGIPFGFPIITPTAEALYKKASREMFDAEFKMKNLSNSLLNLTAKFYWQNIIRNVEQFPHQSSIVQGERLVPRRNTVLKITPDGEHTTRSFMIQSDWILNDSHFIIAGAEIWERELFTTRERELLIETLSEDLTTVISRSERITGEKPIPDSRYRSLGIFVQDEFRLLDNRLKLTLGGRFDQINVENEEAYNPLYEITNGVRNNFPSNQKKIWEAEKNDDISWSGNISLLYSVNEETELTLTAARAFRSPSLEERYQYIDLANIVRIGNPDLRPEQGYFFDGGLRLWQDEFTFTGNVFINFLRDLVAEAPGVFETRPALYKTNVGRAALYGFDFGFQYEFLEKYLLSGTASYVRGEDTENNRSLPQIAPLNGRLSAGAAVFDFLNITLASVFSSAQDKVSPGELKTPGFVVFDFYLNTVPLNAGLFRIQFFGGIENLLNKSYRNHLTTSRGFVLSEPARNYFLKLKLGW